jgi:hypothetical protein
MTTTITTILSNVKPGDVVTVNGTKMTITVAGAPKGTSIIQAVGARGGEKLIVQNVRNPNAWYLIAGSKNDLVVCAA